MSTNIVHSESEIKAAWQAELSPPKVPTENNACNSKTDSVKLRREIDESIRNLTREIIRLRRLKEVV